MGEIGAEPNRWESDYQVLEALVVENADLERLETLLDQFNLFEALGAVRQELRHSALLAFLLNPRQNHGLGDAFPRRLLQKVLAQPTSLPLLITPIDLDIWSLDQLEVRREWENIDILLLDHAHHLAIVMENKIDTTEHSNQLQRYRQLVLDHYPGWKLLCLYLTPDGELPSDEAYIPLTYTLVCQVIEGLAKSRASTLGADILVLLNHYTEMLRRHIVQESEIAELCQRIYQKHQRALDLIFEYRPDQQARLTLISETVRKLIQETSGLLPTSISKGSIRFVPEEWNTPLLKADPAFSSYGYILLFYITNRPNSLKLSAYIAPGPKEPRQRLLEVALAHQPPFKAASRKLNDQWNTIYDRPLLGPKLYEEKTDDELVEEARKQWSKFVEHDLVEIRAVVRTERWIWDELQ